ncbi:MAG: selenocysteine-specific translation elongation factor [Planctomycetota bacterium]
MARGILPIAVGTAGHVDHGKSSLVRSLTGIDPDRLREERERGLTIDLGFAPFEGPDGRRLSFVDVPGHERFLRNAVAGVSGVDIVLLVVSAEDGVMPQTLEHFEVIAGFGVPQVIGVLTKVDLVDETTAELAAEELKDLLQGSRFSSAPVTPVSVVSGQGLDELKEVLWQTACAAKPRSADGPFRMPIQRVFSLEGIGTVTTGIPESGVVNVGDELELSPRGGRVRVRGIQAFGGSVERARAGHSTALSVPDARELEPSRGDVLVTSGAFPVGERVDVRLQISERSRRVRHRDHVRLHLGTAELLGTIALLDRDQAERGEEIVCEIFLNEPFPAAPGELGLLRLETPPEVVGGVEVLGVGEGRTHRRRKDAFDRLSAVASAGDDPEQRVLAELRVLDTSGGTVDELADRAGLTKEVVLETAARSEAIHHHARGRRLFVGELIGDAREDVLDVLGRTLRPRGAASMPLGDLRKKFGNRPNLFDAVVDLLVEAAVLRHQGGGSVLWVEALQPLPPDRAAVLDAILAHCAEAGMQPPTEAELTPVGVEASGGKLTAPDVLALVSRGCDEGKLLRAGDFLFDAACSLNAQRVLRDQAMTSDGDVDLPTLRDQLGTTRKWLIPWLEHNDQQGLTRLRGGKRRFLAGSDAARALDQALGEG